MIKLSSLFILLSTILLSLNSPASEIVKAKVRVEVPDTPAFVWQKYGDFCAVAEWHPAVVSCEISEKDNDTFRTLTLADGAQLLEKYLGQGPIETSYKYSLIEGPLPVSNYISVFEVKWDDDGAGIKWTSEFNAVDLADAEAKAAIEGVYAAGLNAIVNAYKTD